jgi:aryl-alcohol dehydrogenase-like predicted oxidoreductase
MREPEATKFAVCEELGIGLVAWGPLGQGFLTGAISRGTKFDDPNDLRRDFPRFSPAALEANFKIVDFLRALALRKNATPAQIALAWLLAQKPCGPPTWSLRRAICTKSTMLSPRSKSLARRFPSLSTPQSIVEACGGS